MEISSMGNRQLAPTGTIVVTGASSGIGKACALQLDTLGMRVAAGVRRERDGEALRREASDRLTPILLDITDATAISAAVDCVTTASGETGLAGIINNAGIAVAGPLELLPLSELRKQLEVNVIGQIAVTQAFLPLLRRGKGRVVMIGSLGGRIVTPFTGAYCASKFAMEALTDALRMELRPWHMHVSIIEPGFIDTPIWEKSKEAASAMLDSLPSQADDLYGTIIPAARDTYFRAGMHGTHADEVARVV